ncbi:type II secretion system F family protein [Fimbriimonas ginsengisoli]|uniref:Type II secretion system protein n=1 Tax=Fimbriimonas ginsengisoli Gsoil 348 TaxID=661478 RepID=A0A068NQY2_FIMGI|nr:type II secretion system F family protein [Fimbriimonas ginsengisoli]AIE83994.1 type II secretion system protein [Fimbriimonas ginsengisoli Gsoil 348]
MPNYQYKARDLAGNLTTGVVFADNDAALRTALRDSRLYLVDYKKSLDGGDRGLGSGRPRKVKLLDLVVASRQLATLVRAGLPIIETLATLRAQVENPTLSAALAQIQSEVMSGSSLHEAMAKHPKIFTRLCIALVAAGEAGGMLDKTLDIMADQLDKENQIQQQIKGAMAYPKLVCVACGGVIAFMLTFIVPVFEKVYTQFNAQLPSVTLLLVTMSNFVTHMWWMALMLIFLFIKAIKGFRATKPGTKFFDTMALKMPIFGPIMRKIAIGRFAQTFAGSTRSGIPILNALAVCADTSGNTIIHAAIMKVASQVSEGAPLAPSLDETGQFPPMVTRMIAAGEKSGNLDEMLDEIAKFYSRDVDYAVEKMTKLLEPLMTIVVGGIVLFVLLALYMPVFSLSKVIKK